MQKSNTIRKAIIPAAGLGTRLFPASWAVKKEFFPVITPEGEAKPLILTIVEEVIAAGIEEVGIIIRPDARPEFERLFSTSFDRNFLDRLPAAAQAQCRRIQSVSEHVTLIPQQSQEGFGHAVHCTADWVGGQPFMLLLGDHYYGSGTERSCTSQMLDAFKESGGGGVIGASVTKLENAPHYGIMAGTPLTSRQDIYQLSAFVEKPEVEYARRHLTTPGLQPDQLLCVFGIYALAPEIFDILEHDIRTGNRYRGEIQLTNALDKLREKQGLHACQIDGFQCDIGRPQSYLTALNKIAASKN